MPRISCLVCCGYGVMGVDKQISGGNDRKKSQMQKPRQNAGISTLRRAKNRAAPVEMTELWEEENRSSQTS